MLLFLSAFSQLLIDKGYQELYFGGFSLFLIEFNEF